ncbi:unnamed protein product, partial [Vitis vinifera]
MYYFLVFQKKLFFGIQFPNIYIYIYIFFLETPKTVFKNCSQKLFSRIILKNNNQTDPKLLLFIYLVACHSIFLLSSQDHLLLGPFLFFYTFSLPHFIYFLNYFYFFIDEHSSTPFFPSGITIIPLRDCPELSLLRIQLGWFWWTDQRKVPKLHHAVPNGVASRN